MSDILSQAEIEALLNSLNDGEEESGEKGGAQAAAGETASEAITASVAKPSSGNALSYEVYDFRRPDKFSKEQLRTLQMLHETYARLAGTALSAYLRCPINIDLISLEQVPYEEYLRSINKSVFSVISIPPLSGEAALEVEFELVFAMIDRLLGGPGKTLDRARLTEIELPLMRSVTETMLQALKAAWEGVVVVNPAIESVETSAQFVQIAPPSDIVVSILFEVRMGDLRGAMSLCIPYMLLKPITAKLSAQKWFVASATRRQSGANRAALHSMIEESPLECSIQLGRTKLSVDEFLRLRAGDVLRLDQKSEKDLKMLVGGQAKYDGRPALNGNKLAFNITRKRTES